MTTTPEEGISQYNIPLPPPFGLLFFISCYGWSFSVALVVVDMCWFFFFHLGLLILHMLFTPGYFFFHLVTHTPTLQRFSADAHRFTLKYWCVVGGVGVGGTNKPTHHQTHPANHLPTNSHPSLPIPTQPPCKVSASTCIAQQKKRSQDYCWNTVK